MQRYQTLFRRRRCTLRKWVRHFALLVGIVRLLTEDGRDENRDVCERESVEIEPKDEGKRLLVIVLVAIDVEQEEPVRKLDMDKKKKKRLARIKFFSTAFYVPSTQWLRGRKGQKKNRARCWVCPLRLRIHTCRTDMWAMNSPGARGGGSCQSLDCE